MVPMKKLGEDETACGDGISISPPKKLEIPHILHIILILFLTQYLYINNSLFITVDILYLSHTEQSNSIVYSVPSLYGVS